MRGTTIERFLAKVEVAANGCWLWIKPNNAGYGVIRVKGRQMRAHRWAYEHWRSPIPNGLELGHVICDTPSCVNPWHVEPATHRFNLLRGNTLVAQHAKATHCPQGHPYSGSNLYVHPTRWRRDCLACARERMRVHRGRDR